MYFQRSLDWAIWFCPHQSIDKKGINPKKDDRQNVGNIKIVSIGVLIADALRRIYLKESLGGVFYEGFDADAGK